MPSSSLALPVLEALRITDQVCVAVDALAKVDRWQAAATSCRLQSGLEQSRLVARTFTSRPTCQVGHFFVGISWQEMQAR